MKVNYLTSKSQIAIDKATEVDIVVNFHGQQQSSRRPINLSLVLDRSGSMSGSPLRNAIKATEALL